MKIKKLSIAIAVALILLANFQPVFAGSWLYHYSGAYVQATSYAGGGKRVSKVSNTLWLAEISSITTPAIAIPVGWTYWTSREVCNGNITQQAIHSGRSVVQTSTYDYQYMTTKSCGSTRSGQVLGKHEVKGNIFIFRDDWTQSDYIP